MCVLCFHVKSLHCWVILFYIILTTLVGFFIVGARLLVTVIHALVHFRISTHASSSDSSIQTFLHLTQQESNVWDVTEITYKIPINVVNALFNSTLHREQNQSLYLLKHDTQNDTHY